MWLKKINQMSKVEDFLTKIEEQEIVEAILENDVVIISGETGSG